MFSGNETDENSDFWRLLANFVCDLYPQELMSTLEKAFDDDLIAPEMIGLEEFHTALENGKERCLERLRRDLERHSLKDIHDSMSWWACFNEEPQFYSAQDPDDLINYSHPAHSDPSPQKKKRKQAKASKKKTVVE